MLTIQDIIQSAKDSAKLVGVTDPHEIWGYAWSAWEAAKEAGQINEDVVAEDLEAAFDNEFGEDN